MKVHISVSGTVVNKQCYGRGLLRGTWTSGTKLSPLFACTAERCQMLAIVASRLRCGASLVPTSAKKLT